MQDLDETKLIEVAREIIKDSNTKRAFSIEYPVQEIVINGRLFQMAITLTDCDLPMLE